MVSPQIPKWEKKSMMDAALRMKIIAIVYLEDRIESTLSAKAKIKLRSVIDHR